MLRILPPDTLRFFTKTGPAIQAFAIQASRSMILTMRTSTCFQVVEGAGTVKMDHYTAACESALYFAGLNRAWPSMSGFAGD